MADVQSAQQAVQEAQQQNVTARAGINRAQQAIQSRSFMQGEQSALRVIQQKQAIQKQIESSSKALAEREAQVADYASKVNEAAAAQQSYNQQAEDYRIAEVAFKTGNVFALSNENQRKIYRDIVSGQKEAIKTNLSTLENQGVDEATLAQIENELKNKLGRVSTAEINTNVTNILRTSALEKQKVEVPKIEEQKLDTVSVPTAEVKQFGGIEVQPAKDNVLLRWQSEFETTQARGERPTVLQNIKNIAGAGTQEVISTAKGLFNLPKLAYSFVTSPKQTIEAVKLSTPQVLESAGEKARSNPVAFLTGFASQAILFKGLSKSAEIGTQKLYQVADLPKVNAFTLTEQTVTPGGNIARTAADIEVKGIFRNQLYKAATETQTVPSINNKDLVFSATRGVIREQKLMGGYKAPTPFVQADTGVVKEYTAVYQRNVGGLTITQPVPTTLYGGFSATKVGQEGKTIFSGNAAVAIKGRDYDLVLGYSRPVQKTKEGYKILSGESKTYAVVRNNKQFAEPTSFGGSTVQTTKGFPSSIIQNKQKSLMTSVAKEQFVKSSSKKASEVVKPIPSIGQKAEVLKSTQEQVFATKIEVQPKQSLYFGTGQYEKTQETQAAISSQDAKQDTSQGLSFRLTSSKSQEYLQSTPSVTTQEFITKPATAQFTSLGTAQPQKQEQKQPQRLTENQSQIKTSIRANVPMFALSKKSNSRLGRKIELFKKAFKVFSRRKGKEILVAKDLPQNRALLAGKKYAESTLARSIRLEESGTTKLEDIRPVNLKGFRPSKRDSGRMVQINALSSRTEVRDILSAKKAKNKKGWFK